MRFRSCVLLAALAAVVSACSPTQVRYRPASQPPDSGGEADAVLFLVGDAGEVNPERADILAHLATEIGGVARGGSGPPVLVAFLGDNIYDEGLPTEPSEKDLAKLNGQVLALGDDADVAGVFLPGNHDWANGASIPDGRAAVARQADWIETVSPGRDIQFLPDDGCPGPAGRDLGSTVHLVFIDTEWLLRRPEERCGSVDAFYGRLTAHLRAHADRLLVVLAHHPLVSGGPHGGNVAPLEMGPFVYYLARKSGASAQDLASGRYSTMVGRLEEAIAASGARPLAFAAGHDHTLQVIAMAGAGTPAFQLVSGAGSKTERSRRIEGTRYATDGYGYMRIDFTRNGSRLTVFARDVDRGPVRPVFSCALTEEGTGCPEAPRAEASP
jgi:hypothetical protein